MSYHFKINVIFNISTINIYNRIQNIYYDVTQKNEKIKERKKNILFLKKKIY